LIKRDAEGGVTREDATFRAPAKAAVKAPAKAAKNAKKKKGGK